MYKCMRRYTNVKKVRSVFHYVCVSCEMCKKYYNGDYVVDSGVHGPFIRPHGRQHAGRCAAHARHQHALPGPRVRPARAGQAPLLPAHHRRVRDHLARHQAHLHRIRPGQYYAITLLTSNSLYFLLQVIGSDVACPKKRVHSKGKLVHLKIKQVPNRYNDFNRIVKVKASLCGKVITGQKQKWFIYIHK